MYEIKVMVEVPGLPEALTALAGALSKGQPTAVFTQNGVNGQQIENAGTINIGKPAEAIPNAKENHSAPSAPMPAQTTQTVPTATPAAETKVYGLDDLSRAGAALIDRGKMPQLIDLLKKYGVQAVTQLDASVYPAFVEEMKALGAQF